MHLHTYVTPSIFLATIKFIAIALTYVRTYVYTYIITYNNTVPDMLIEREVQHICQCKDMVGQ